MLFRSGNTLTAKDAGEKRPRRRRGRDGLTSMLMVETGLVVRGCPRSAVMLAGERMVQRNDQDLGADHGRII